MRYIFFVKLVRAKYICGDDLSGLVEDVLNKRRRGRGDMCNDDDILANSNAMYDPTLED